MASSDEEKDFVNNYFLKMESTVKDSIYAFSLLLILGDFPVCFTEFLTAGSLKSRWDNSREKYELN